MSSVIVNDVALNLEEIYAIISQGNKIHAIKHIKDRVNISLKDCKNIVDNLESNPYYYEGETEIILKHSISDFKDNHQKAHKHNRKGNHIITEKPNNQIKNYIIIALVVCIIIMLYSYLNNL